MEQIQLFISVLMMSMSFFAFAINGEWKFCCKKVNLQTNFFVGFDLFLAMTLTLKTLSRQIIASHTNGQTYIL